MAKINPEDILVIYKKSRYALYKERSKKKIERFVHEHKLHKTTMKLAHEILRGATFIYRSQLNENLVKKYKLLVTIGGDGTVLDASHFCYTTPILGVNSTFDKNKGSEGFFCSANRFNLKAVMKKLFNNELDSFKLNRLQVKLNGKPIKPLALNEAMVAHAVPAAGSYYSLKIGNKVEFHKTYGLIVATAAGSTAAIRSHGGKVMPIKSKRIQYWARAPFDGRVTKHKLRSGILPPNTVIEIVSEMRDGRVYIDGHHCVTKFGLDDKITIQNSDWPLTVYNLNLESRKKHYK